MKILISVKDKKEASAVIKGSSGGVELIDIKNPEEGTLGANYPWVIQEIKKVVPKSMKIAASIGDLDFKPGFASLAAYGASFLGLDYITASIFNVKNENEVEEIESSIFKSMRLNNEKTELIIAGYADYGRIETVNPFDFIGRLRFASMVMLDTAIKDGKNIFSFFSKQELLEFKQKCRKKNMKFILAGSLREADLKDAVKISPDYLGFRGIVCGNGEVKEKKVRKLVEMLNV